MFYLFVQNNSGGFYHHNVDEGIGINVAFEANSEDDAIDRAKYVIYFDGVEEGYDCPCCGDRWSAYTWAEAETIEELNKRKYNGLSDDDSTMYVHMLDGTVVSVK